MNVPFLDIRRQYQMIKEEIDGRIAAVMESCTFIGGSTVQEFERQAAEFLGVKHALGCSDGTQALVLALHACGVGPGDEVITTPFTFFATAEAIASLGAAPVFVDIREDNYNIDPEQIEEKITPKTKAILPVHIFGSPCDMDRITAIAHQYKLSVIEDCAQSIGSQYKNKKTGSLGAVGCFSFYPTKNLGAFGDGGMVATDDDELAVILSALREHGAAQKGARAWELMNGRKNVCTAHDDTATGLYNPYKYYNYLIGYNSRLDAIQAAVLLAKLPHLEEYNAARTKVAAAYQEGLCDQVVKPAYATHITPCWHQYVVKTPHKEKLCAYLQENGVGSGTFYPVPLHLQKAFLGLGYAPGSLPVVERVASQSVCLPIFPELTEKEISYVIETVNRFFVERV